MTNRRTTPRTITLPYHKLAAYHVALELLAMRAAKSAALNVAEAAGRSSRADRARVFGIARGEAMEAAAALEIAVLAGDASTTALEAALPVADRLMALLTGLCR
jgi:four helix bundle protein